MPVVRPPVFPVGRLRHSILGRGLLFGWQENDDPCRRPIAPIPCPARELNDHAPTRFSCQRYSKWALGMF